MLRRRVVLLTVGRDFKSQNISRIEARVNAEEPNEAPRQQARADKEHECEGDFGDHETPADLMACRAGATLGPAFLERRHQTRHARVQHRRESTQHTGRRGYAAYSGITETAKRTEPSYPSGPGSNHPALPGKGAGNALQ